MTYNQIVKEIQTLLETHKMINTVRFATPAEWLNWDNQPVFPLASFAINRGGLNAGREQTYLIEMWFLDKSGVESEFETDVVSDMHLVAADIISTLRKQSNPYTIDISISWDAVSEKFEDYLSGVYLTFNLSVVSAYDACSMPV
jgi:hypothetical protein